MPDGNGMVRGENETFTSALFDALFEGGLVHVCLSPGSRSTPLVVGAVGTPGLTLHPHLDERSAAFFALGLARASRHAVALVCTSGTAAANFLPAVVEAHYARVPLIVLTADRPPELRGWGAGQTIDQIGLYGRHVRLFVEAPVPSPGVDLVSFARALAARAIATAEGSPPGVVHVNLPFREPLEPSRAPGSTALGSDALRAGNPGTAPYTRVSSGRRVPDPDLVLRVCDALCSVSRGVIVAGPTDRDASLPAEVARLARTLGWPVLAEPTSQLRTGPHVQGTPIVAHADALLRDSTLARIHVPEAVIRIGDTPTSKPVRQWLDPVAAAHVHRFDPDGVWHDPNHRGGAEFHVDAPELCAALSAALTFARPSAETLAFTGGMLTADRIAARTFDDVLAAEPRLFAPLVVREIARALPDGATLFVSNSMSVRDVDTFLPVNERRLRVLCNRGANGIDGIVSTALGVSAATTGPTLLLTGDLAFLHDVGGLFAAKALRSSCTIVILNDDGGGIFSYLPIAEHGDDVRFRELFTLPHGLSLSGAATLYGISHQCVTGVDELRTILAHAIASPGVHLVEVQIDREASVRHHRALWRALSAALASEPGAL